jgi:hypothetical protein
MREKVQFLDSFWIKILAFLTMALDHIGYFLTEMGYFADNSVGMNLGILFRVIGRLSFPLFALLLAEGMRKSKNREKYICRLAGLWAFIFIVQAILYLAKSPYAINQEQAFTDLLCYALFVYLVERKDWTKVLALIPLAWIALSYAADVSEVYSGAHQMTSYWSASFPIFTRGAYSLYGFLIFLGFYYAYPLADLFIKKSLQNPAMSLEEYHQSKEYRSLVNLVGITFLLVINLLFWAATYGRKDLDPYQMGTQAYSVLSIFFLVCYSGKRGYDSKFFRYVEYLFYPVHLAIIALVFDLIF